LQKCRRCLPRYVVIVASASTEDEFEKWQREIKDAEAEAERLKNGSVSGTELVEDDHERASSPPEGEDEFTDDDGTKYKWDRARRVWVPQVRLCFVHQINHSFPVSTILVSSGVHLTSKS